MNRVGPGASAPFSTVSSLVAPGTSTPANSDDLLTRYKPTIDRFRVARRTLEAFTDFARTSDYPALMLELRVAVLRLTADNTNIRARELVERAARALDVPRPDLMALARVPADMVARGLWRPRSVNCDLTSIDAAAKVEEAGFQSTLNRWSHKIFPKTPAVDVPGMNTAYRVLEGGVNELSVAGDLITAPIDHVAAIVRGWSDDLASDTQKTLRGLANGLRPAQLSKRDLRKLDPVSRREVVNTAKWLSGLLTDTQEIVSLLRSEKGGKTRDSIAAARPALWKRAESRLSSGLFGIARFLEGVSSTVQNATSLENWETFSIHYLALVSGVVGSKVGGVSSPFSVGSGFGAALMFPTLEQFRREGKAQLRIVPNLWMVESAPGGLSLTSRGSEIRQRFVVASAQVAEYEHHVTGGIPNTISMDFGEDYAYGPLVAFYQLIPFRGFGALDFKIGGETRVFHPAFAPLSLPTHAAAEFITMLYDVVQRGLRKHEPTTKAKTKEEAEAPRKNGAPKKNGAPGRDAATSRGLTPTPPPPAAPRTEWPEGQSWRLAEKKLMRSEHALETIERRRSELRAIERPSPTDTPPVPPRETALPSGARLGELRAYLVQAPTTIRGLEDSVRKLARRASAGEKVSVLEIRKALRALDREVRAFEYVDVFLATLVAEHRPSGARREEPSPRRTGSVTKLKD